jgi:hypothetical protein
VVGEYIRNPTLRLLPLQLSTFPQAIVKKEKEPKRKKTAAAVPLTLSKNFPTRTIRGLLPHTKVSKLQRTMLSTDRQMRRDRAVAVE